MILNNYKTSSGEICFLAGFADMIAYEGVNISEDFLLGMSVGLKFRILNEVIYNLDVNRPIDCVFLECIDIHRDWKDFDLFFKYYGFQLVKIVAQSKEKFLNEMEKSLVNQRSVLVAANIYYLDYHIEFRNLNLGHYITIWGIDKENNRVYISDNYIPAIHNSTYNGEMVYENFLEAIDLDRLKIIYKFMGYKLEGKVLRRSIATKEIVDRIKKSGQSMLNSKSGEWITGVEAIKSLIVMIKELEKCNNNENTNIKLERLNLMLAGLAGPVQTRLLFGKFLEYVNTNTNIKLVNGIGGEYILLSKEWKIVATLLLKICKTGKYNKLEKVQDKIKAILEKEISLADALIKVEYTGNETIYL